MAFSPQMWIRLHHAPGVPILLLFNAVTCRTVRLPGWFQIYLDQTDLD
jgi:hypothetical protein